MSDMQTAEALAPVCEYDADSGHQLGEDSEVALDGARYSRAVSFPGLGNFPRFDYPLLSVFPTDEMGNADPSEYAQQTSSRERRPGSQDAVGAEPATTHTTSRDELGEVPAPFELNKGALPPSSGGMDEAYRLAESSRRQAVNTLMTATSMAADSDNMHQTFMTPSPTVNAKVRGRQYANRVNPLTRTLWGPGSLVGLYNGLGELEDGNYTNGGRYLLQNGANFANYVSAHGKKYGQYAKQESLFKPYYQSIHWLSTGRTGWAANRVPHLAPGIGALFSGLSLAERQNRPETLANYFAMGGDAASLGSLAVMFLGQNLSGHAGRNALVQRLLPYMIRGGIFNWYVQIPGLVGDAYHSGAQLRQAAYEADPESKYYGLMKILGLDKNHRLMRLLGFERKSVVVDD